MTLDDILRRNAKLYPDRLAVLDPGTGERERRERSWAELDRRVLAQAAGLRALGVAAGDRVAILLPNCIEVVETYFALARLDAIAVPVSIRLKTGEVGHILRDSGACLAISTAASLPVLGQARKPGGALGRVILVGGGEGDDTLGYERLLTLAPSLAHGAQGRSEDGIALLVYTSGTTGVPKGAMLSHRNILSTIQSAALERGLTSADRYLHVTPLHHIGGVASLFSTAYTSGAQILVDKFDASRFWGWVEDHGITHTLLMPTMVGMVLDALGAAPRQQRRTSPLRLIYYGGEPMPLERLRQAMALCDCKFMQGYGLTEASGLCTSLRPEDHVIQGSPEQLGRLRSAGRETYHVEVRLVDEEGQEVARGGVGELAVRGPGVMRGYWNRPEETGRALVDGWLRTGDLGREDEAGYITIVDRKKDMIISGGVNIYPREIERVLGAHPAVADVAVIGVPDPRWGEAVKAVVVRRPGPLVSAGELIEFCRAELADYKRPRTVDFVAELPRNATGKLLKTELRRLFS